MIPIGERGDFLFTHGCLSIGYKKSPVKDEGT